MEFLVRIEAALPPQMPADERRRIAAAELQRGRELKAAGSIRQIWRLPGGYRNVGIWSAADATELHSLIESLPAYPWIGSTVEALAEHPIDREDR